MKNIFAVILSFSILFMSTGFTISTHYCGDKRVKSEFGIGHSDVSCGMEKTEKSCEKKVKSNCCKEQYQAFQIEDDYVKSDVKNTFQNDFTFIDVFTLVQAQLFETKNTQTQFLDYSPPLLEKDITVLVQSFLI